MKDSITVYYSRVYRYSDLIFVVLILSILASMILPIPPFLLDILLTCSISFSLIILMTTVYVKHPLELSSFPSLLLLATLLRLSLNVATTRRILLHGNEGPDAAGNVIKAFGQFVVGGNYVVGIIVFAILVIINYIVVTKGTERISEVAARFVLDAMPGKQMSIDADLNAGLIDEEEARKRREEIAREADFYGAMDGASKFIRGDAIAGIIITLINIVGGLIIGIVQHHMSFSDALKTFTILTVGDGLVSQIPSLITSTAAGLMVTRAAAETDLGQEIFRQLTRYHKPLFMAALILFIVGIVPGMPTLPFSLLAALVAAVGYMVYRYETVKEFKEAQKKAKELMEKSKEEKPEDLIVQPEPITLEIGYSLIPYVDENQGGEIVEKIKNLRKQLVKELGIVIPLVHIRDNLELKPGEYRILLRDVEVARGEVEPNKFLAIDTGGVRGEVKGKPTREPAFGLSAYWVDNSEKDRAKLLGYTVVDVPTVIVTHLSEVIKKHAHEIVSRSDVKEMVTKLASQYPVVRDMVPEPVSYGILTKVIQNLLKEGIPVKDLLTIIESVADNIEKTQDPDLLTEFVRQSLSRLITSLYAKGGVLAALSLSPEAEEFILKRVKENEGYLPPLDPVFVQNLVKSVSEGIGHFISQQLIPVVLTSPAVRRFVRMILEPYLPNVAVLSYAEVEPGVQLNIVGVVEGR